MKFCMGCMEQYEDEYTVCPHCGYIEGTPAEESYYMEPGTILDKHYIVGKVIGTGGFGTTYLGWDYELGRKVAIKEYLPKEFSTRVKGVQDITIYPGEKAEQFGAGITKFIEEAKRLVKFKTVPGIVKFYNCFEENKTAYIIMEYLEGETLKEHLMKGDSDTLYQPMPYEEARPILDCLLDALETVHREGIIHRDIAPDNIFLTKDGKVKLIDFGSSRFATTRHSRSLTVLIKEGYAPQEQYRSRGDQGPWTDVYSVAATFYTMLTGKVLQDAMEREANDQVQKPSKLGVKGLPKHVENAIMNALNRKIEDRTQSCEEFKKQLSDENTKWNFIRQRKIDIGRWPLWLKIVSATGGTAVASFLVLLATGVISFSSMMSAFVSKSEVPFVVGDTKEVAEETLNASGFECVYANYVEDEAIAKDCIFNQNPGANAELKKGEAVYLAISCGSIKKIMPNVVGYDVSVAEKMLENLKLDNLEVKTVTVNKPEIMVGAGENTVVRQLLSGNEIAEGTEVNSGMVITLEVAGKTTFEDGANTVVPEFTGKMFADAKQEASDSKVLLRKTSKEYSEQPKDIVLNQGVQVGESVEQGHLVDVTVSAGSDISIGIFKGKRKQDVMTMIEEQGIKVSWSEQENKNVPAGRIISQSVEPGETMNYKDTLKLVVSTGSADVEVDESKIEEMEKNVPSTAPTAPPNAKTSKKKNANKKDISKTENTKGTINTAIPTADTNVSVPSVVGKSFSEAISVLQNAKLNYKTEYQFNSEIKTDCIISQTPKSGNVKMGTIISLVVSKGKKAPTEWTTDDSFVGSKWYTYESKTQYLKQMREKETKSSSKSSLSGWTLDKAEWGTYGDWSGWSKTVVFASDSREVQTKTVPATYETQYNYERYLSDDKMTSGPTKGVWGDKYCGNHQERGWSTSRLNCVGTQYSKRIGTFSLYGSAPNWYYEIPRNVEKTPEYTLYRYREQSKIYYYYKYTDWSDGEWKDEKPEESEVCQSKKTRKVYFYKEK